MLALRNGTIIDGTGGAPYTGTVLVDGDRISLVDEHTPADTSFDCEGLAISPGFFDLHSHSDIQALDPARREKIKQGVTAELVGNCGFSPFPIGDDAGQLREFARGIFCEADGWGWREGRDYLHAAAAIQRRDGCLRARRTWQPAGCRRGYATVDHRRRAEPHAGATRRSAGCGMRRPFDRTDVRTGICRGFRRTRPAAACRRETWKAVRDTHAIVRGGSRRCRARAD